MTKTSRRTCHAAIACLSVILPAAPTNAEKPPTLDWIRQVGTPRTESFDHVKCDEFGNVFVSEFKISAVPGDTFRGDYIHKFDLTGRLLWTREIGNSDTSDSISGTWVDNKANLYVTAGGDPY